MKRFNEMKNYIKPAAAAVALMLVAGPASAVTYDLCAGSMMKSLPDGSSVPMWGYAEADTGNGCTGVSYSVPGPRLTVPVGDSVLIINLTNNLTAPTSLVIPGLSMPVSTGAGPTWNDNNTGGRTGPTQRVRSFGAEAAANGGTESYSFTVDRPGTFIYHSGTHPQNQVYMGLYGAATKDEVAEDIPTETSAEAYPGVPYDNEVVLFYSDIDPVHNAAVAAGDLSYTPINYNAQWFLINGEPYEAGMTEDIPAGLASGDPLTLSRSDTLIRFLSAASETHVPVIQGLRMAIHAEDGLQYNYQDGDMVAGMAPRNQYSAMLPPLKTKDAIIAPTTEGRYAVYDGNGYMTNPSDIDNFAVGDEVGGMLRFLSVAAANQKPVAVNDGDVNLGQDEITTPEDTSIEINVIANDSDPDGDELTIIAVTDGAIGTVTISDPLCCVLYTPNSNANGLDEFTYTITDSNGVTSTATAMVDVTVEAVNDAPVAVDDSSSTVYPDAVDVDVLANDTDVDGDALSISAFDATSAAGGTVDCTGSICTYTPGIAFSGDDTFTYTVSDGNLTDTATVTVTVDAPPVMLYMSLLGNGSLAGLGPNGTDLAYADEDILSWNGYWYETVFDGSAAGVTANDVFGFNIETNRILLIFQNPGTVGGVAYDDSDVVAVTCDDFVAGTNCSFSLFFDGSDVGLNVNNNGERLDAVNLLPDGRLLVSTRGGYNVPTPGVANGADEDLLAFTGTFGATTSGVWALYFDGSDVDLASNNGEDVNATSVAANGDIYLSTLNAFTVGGGALSGQDEDVFVCSSPTTGANSACSAYSTFFDGTANGLGGVDEINAIDLP